ncbi:MAG: hypothetical protein U9N46_14900 [Euryarchaeota archaeon]|nr:hypothetical protein [Euryarchaeota archaeon]
MPASEKSRDHLKKPKTWVLPAIPTPFSPLSHLPPLLLSLILLLSLLLLPLSLLPDNACATTEITVHRTDYNGCVLLIIDGLGSSYCYPEFTPHALDNSTLKKANCTNLLAIAGGGMRAIDVRAPVTSTHPGHSVIVTGCADAKPQAVADRRTIFDVAHENGYFCVGIMENGDFEEMCAELDIILHVKKNSITNPGIAIDAYPYGNQDLSNDINDLMTKWSNITEYLGDKDGVERYVAYNRWAIDVSDAIARTLCESHAPFIMIINIGAVDSAGHHLGASGYPQVIDGTDDAIRGPYQRCASNDLLFVLTADHGMGFATHGAAHGGHASDKYAKYPESQRIPLVFSGCGVAEGTIATAGQEDIAPTLLCQMGLPTSGTLCDGDALPVGRYADLRVLAGSGKDVVDVEVRGCGDTVAGTSDSEFIFRGLNMGYNYTIKVTRNGKTDEHELFLNSDYVVDCSAAGDFLAAPDVPESRKRGEHAELAGLAFWQEDAWTKVLRIAVPIVIINLVGMFLIVRIMRE